MLLNATPLFRKNNAEQHICYLMLLHCFERTIQSSIYATQCYSIVSKEQYRVAYMLLNTTPLFRKNNTEQHICYTMLIHCCERTIQSSIYATQCYSIVSKEQYRVAYMLHNATPLLRKNNTEQHICYTMLLHCFKRTIQSSIYATQCYSHKKMYVDKCSNARAMLHSAIVLSVDSSIYFTWDQE